MQDDAPAANTGTGDTGSGGSPDSPVLAQPSTLNSQPPPAIPDHELVRPIGHGAYGEVWLARHARLGTLRAVKIIRRDQFDHDRPFQREFDGIRRYEPISRGHPNLVAILHVGGTDECFFYVMELADAAVAADVRRLTSPGPRVSPPAAASEADRGSQHSQHPSSDIAAAAGDSRGPMSEPPHVGCYAPHTLRSELKRHGALPIDRCLEIGRALAGGLAHLHARGLVHRDVKPSNVIFVGGVAKLADIGLVAAVSDSRSYVGTEGYIPPEGPGAPSADCYALGKLLYELSTGQDRTAWPEPPADLPTRPDRERLLELNAILHRACAPQPSERYRDADAMLTDLERLSQGVSIRKVRRAEHVWREVRRSVKLALAAAIVLSLGILVSRTGRQPAQRSVDRRSTNEIANRYFDLGLHAFERLADTDIPLAVTNFQKAIEADSGFARAHAELALIYSRPQSGKGNRDSYAAAKAEAELALKLDPALPLAHIVIGWSKVFHGFRWRDAEKDFLHALELDPHWDRSHHGYAEFLKASGRTDQAVAEMSEALHCNPQSVRVRQRLPYVLVAARRFEDAIKEAEDAIAMEPNSVGNAYYALIDAWCARRNYLKAIEAQHRLLLAGRTSPEEATLRIGNLRKAFEADGAKGYWRVRLKDAQQIDDSPYWLACIHAQLGEREPALDCLNACLRDVAFDLIWSVKIDWHLDPLRSDPAFQDILKALNLE